MAAGIPGLTRQGKDRLALSEFAGTLASWIALTALPLCLGVAVFAHPLIEAAFGQRYLGAVPVMRILMLAGLLALGSNVTGIVLMSKGIVGPQILFNAISLVVNVTGNILLVPHYGVIASAWLTVISEAIVLSYGLVILRAHLSWRRVGRAVWRPAIASVVAAAVGFALRHYDLVGIPLAIVCFGALLTALRAWPEPLAQAVIRKRRPGIRLSPIDP
jgi:O-antigen/teichoic acid export membrane protein